MGAELKLMPPLLPVGRIQRRSEFAATWRLISTKQTLSWTCCDEDVDGIDDVFRPGELGRDLLRLSAATASLASPDKPDDR